MSQLPEIKRMNVSMPSLDQGGSLRVREKLYYFCCKEMVMADDASSLQGALADGALSCLVAGPGNPGDDAKCRALTSALLTALGGPVDRLLVVLPTVARSLQARVGAGLKPCLQPQGHLVLEVEPLPETQAATVTTLGSAEADPFDAVLCLDPRWGRCAVDTLRRVHNRLRVDGILVLAGLVHMEIPVTPPDEPWPVLPFLQAQVRRCGFGALVRVKSGMAQSRVAPIVAHSRASLPPRWSLRPLEPTMAGALRHLFAEVFAPNTMSPEVFAWKYGAGRGLGMTAWRHGELVAFYGGLPRRVFRQGRETQAVQIVDVMVRSNERGILRREGVFFQTAATFIEAYVGYGTHFPFGFGFPTERHHRVAERMGFYVVVDKLHELSWPCRPGPGAWSYRLVPLDADAISGLATTINRLWAAMCNSLPHAILGVRDARFIRHRFLAHPTRRYQYYLLRRAITRQPLALLVLASEDGILHLRDYVGDLRHLPIAIGQLRSLGAERGLMILAAWITSGFLDRFPSQDRADKAMEIVIPHNIWTPGPPAADMRCCWWLMGGDTDFL